MNAQPGIFRRLGSGGMPSGGGSTDSFQRRDRFADSITLRYRYLNNSRSASLDTSINDFNKKFPVPYTHHYLGNPGTAATSIVFAPTERIGFNAGFNAYDVYRWNIDSMRFYNTTRPYTELSYLLGTQTQQIIEVLHTQNPKPYLNISFNYRLINSPGFFKNQRTNHNNYGFTSWYNAPRKRYNNYLVLLGNRIQAAENGGIKRDQEYLKDPAYDDRFGVPVNLGGNERRTRDPAAQLRTGTNSRDFRLLLRQQYDFGRKDSIVTDSTVIPLFFPRLRFEHTLQWATLKHEFRDYVGDSVYYKNAYGFSLRKQIDTLLLRDYWTEISNDFSIYQFPDAKNLQQFIKAGIEYQLFKGTLRRGTVSLYNIVAHGEYRNRTRNQKWDMSATGRLYLNGYNAGDYHAYVSLQRFISKKVGTVQLGFESINRSPSLTYDSRSSFYFDVPNSFGKENTTHLFASAFNPFLKLQLGADYYLIGNYLYLFDLYKLRQHAPLFNVLRLHAKKEFRIGRRWNLYSEVHLQQKAGVAPLNL
ncbi:MAG: putative porin, partial [Chitinophagaceae bacterium]